MKYVVCLFRRLVMMMDSATGSYYGIGSMLGAIQELRAIQEIVRRASDA